jgi:hypothetical protein
MNGVACCRNAYGLNFLYRSQILCRYFRFVGHHSALFDGNKNNCLTVRGRHGFVDLFEDQNFPGSQPGARFGFVGEREYEPIVQLSDIEGKLNI